MVGPNGIGKSTILKLIAGDLHPSSGTVFRSAKVTIEFIDCLTVSSLKIIPCHAVKHFLLYFLLSYMTPLQLMFCMCLAIFFYPR